MLTLGDRNPAAPGRGAARHSGSFSIVLILALLSSLSAVASLPSRNGEEPRAIVFAPWIGREAAVSRSFEAGYRVLRTGRLDTIVVVASPAAEAPLPRGGWFVLALGGLAGCLDAASPVEQRK